MPSWSGHSKKRADYRFLPIREPLRQLDLGDEENLPFPTQAFGQKGTFELFGAVTNQKGPGDQIIWWLRERCGKSEEVHSVLKSDLAGGQLPSGLFGANGAWRAPPSQGQATGDPLAQPERRDETAGPGQGLDRETDEGCPLPPDRSAWPRGQPGPPTDRPPWWRGRGARNLHRRPSDHPGIGVWTIGMSPRARLHHAAEPLARWPSGPRREAVDKRHSRDSRRLWNRIAGLGIRVAARERTAMNRAN